MKTKKGISEAEKQIDCIQSLLMGEKSTECICPKCGGRHRVKLMWTGRGMPRKFCPVCKHYANSINDTEPLVVGSAAGAMPPSSI